MALLDESHKSLENVVVLYLVQAMLGLVTPNLRAVAVDVSGDRLVVHFAFVDLSQVDHDEIEDIICDLDALLCNEDLPDDWLIETELHEGPPDEHWPGVNYRRVYETKRT